MVSGPLRLSSSTLPLPNNQSLEIILAIDAYYLDYQDNLRSVTIPIVMRLPDGRLFVNDQVREDWTIEQVKDRFAKQPDWFLGGPLGALVFPLVSPDQAASLATYAVNPIADWVPYLLNIRQAYNDSLGSNFTRFLEDGTGQLSTLLPYGIAVGSDSIDWPHRQGDEIN
jgi:hypothetical protein